MSERSGILSSRDASRGLLVATLLTTLLATLLATVSCQGVVTRPNIDGTELVDCEHCVDESNLPRLTRLEYEQTVRTLIGDAAADSLRFDYLPPDGAFAFAYPYRRPILAAKYADSGGGTIDTGSVEVRIDSFNVTATSVVSQTGAYFVPTFDFWLGEIDFKINVANVSGVETHSAMTFNIVEAKELTHLAVEFDGSGDAVLAWDPPVFSNALVFTGYNVYRSTDLQTEMELIGQTFAATFTDDSVPAGPVYYEVHAELEGGSGHRIQTVRDTPFRTDQPFAVSPRAGEFTASGSTQVRILAMVEPGASVTFFADGLPVGNELVAVDGSVSLTHDFGSSGAHTMWVQAKQPGESISIPSVPVTFQIP
jgi:hypothetical protein